MFAIHSSASSSFDDRVVDDLLLALARRCRERSPLDPLRHVRRRVLLEEALALPAVGIALHRERPAAQVRDEHLRDVAVVRDEVALRDPLVGPERLVEVRQAKLPSPRFTVVGTGSRSRLTSGAALSSRRRRYDGARSRPSCVHSANSTSATSTGSTQVTSELRTRGIFGTSANGESGRSSGASSGTQPLDLAVGEPRPDVSGPAQHTRVVYPGDERAEPAYAATLAARVPSDHDLLRLAQLQLVPVRPTGGRACTASPPVLATTPSSSCSRAAARSAGPSSNCGDTSTPPLRADEPARSRFRRSLSGSSGAARTRARAGRRERGPGVPPPSCRSEKRERPWSSSAQISPSRTASDDRIARAAARATSPESLGQVVAVATRERDVTARDRHDRAEAVPLRLVDPALSGRKRIRGRREHRLVATAAATCRRRPCGGAASSSGRRRDAAGTSVQTPSRRSPCSLTVSPPFRFSSSSSYVPRSQISTVPAPYSPAGITPSKSA